MSLNLDCNNNEIIDDPERCITAGPAVLSSLSQEQSQINTKPIDYLCFLCNGHVGFHSSSSLCNHLQSIHRMFAIIHCPVCKMEFYDSKDCNNHILDDHKLIVASTFFKCRLCPKEFSDKKVKDSHILNHYYRLFPRARPFLCETCNTTTFGLSNFLTHIHTHFIVCSLCNGMFKTPTEFYEHFTTVHSSNIKCGICQDIIKDCESYLSHLSTHQIDCPVSVPTTPNDNRIEKHLCFVCDNLFSTKQQFLDHFVQHGFSPALF